MKKFLFAIVIILIVLASFRYISFSKTIGTVLDEESKPIEDATVIINYNCNENNFVDGDGHSFKTEIARTDKTGHFYFDSFNVGFRSRIKYLNACSKVVTTFREGYCRDLQLCTSNIAIGGLTEDMIKNETSQVKSSLLFRNGKYFDHAYFDTSTAIGSDEEVVSLRLNKFDAWYQK